MFALLGSILVIHLFALMSPGPDFVFVTRTAVVESRARALLGVAGIVAGQIVWSGLSLLGLDILFQQFAGLQKIIAFAGGCYLLWMAFGILRSVWRTRAAKSSTVSADAPAPADDAGGVKHAFLYGLFTNLANPKALVYFGSIFSTFVTPDVDASARLLLFVTMTVEAFLWFAAVALLFGSGPLREGYRRIARAIDAVTGVLFAGFGIGLVVSVLRNEA